MDVGDIPQIEKRADASVLFFRVSTRVSLKIKNIFLSPGDFTPNAFKYEEFWKHIAGLWTPDLSDHAIDFWFWDVDWGNRPKMGLKCAIFKICPKLVQKVI